VSQALGPRRLLADRRADQAYALRLRGGSFRDIAEAVGVSTATAARKCVLRGQARNTPDEATVADRRRLASARLDLLRVECWRIMTAPTSDDATKLSAVGRLTRIEAEEMALWGLAAPQRVEHSGLEGRPVEVRVSELLERTRSLRLLPASGQDPPAN
jgi:hypothetical protein